MFSTKGRYALRVMIDLAKQNSESYVPLKEIAERQDISKKYLETIVKELANAGLVRGVSGKGGGYALSRKPQDYTVGEILEVTEGTLAVTACLSKNAPKCPRAKKCETLPMWKEFNELVQNYLYSKKLSVLI